MEIDAVNVEKKEDMQLIIGHAGFIKTAEDLYEAMVNAVPGVKFGIAFAEASGPHLARSEGNDREMRELAEKNIMKIGAGHTFLILFKNAYPINVLRHVKEVNEVANIYCATANPVHVLVAKTIHGNSIVGVVDGGKTKGVENENDKSSRRKFVRDIGYKL